MKLSNKFFIYCLFIFIIPFSLKAELKFETSPTCPGTSNGSIDLTITGNGSPYTFLWSTGAMTEDIDNLAAGTYTVTITYLGGTGTNDCSFEHDVIVDEANCCTDCYPIEGVVNTGSIHVNVECMESSGFTYEWSDGGMGNPRVNLEIGNYSVTVTSSGGCVLFGSWDVTTTCEPIELTPDAAIVTSACTAAPMGGSIQIVAPLPFGTFYVWTGPNNYMGYGSTINNLAAGDYTVSVLSWTNFNCPYAVGTFTVDPDGEQCCSDCYPIEATIGRGSIHVQIECLKTGGFTYEWSDGVTGNPRKFLQPGTYCVTATSSSGCSLSDCWEVGEACPETYPLTDANAVIKCSSGDNGSINLIDVPFFEGAVALWTGPDGYFEIGSPISNLAPGQYCVTYKVLFGGHCDLAYGCFTVTETDLDARVASIKNNDACVGQCAGKIELGVISSSSSLSYSWTGPDGFTATTKDLANLCQGNYNVTVTDGQGCTDVAHATICCCADQQPGEPHTPFCFPEVPPMSNIVLNEIIQISEDIPTGSININSPAGVGSIYYSWSSPDHPDFAAYTQDISGLELGRYCVTATDGCETKTRCFDIVDCSMINWNVPASITPSCPGANAGIITLSNVSGGAPPFRYDWGDGPQVNTTRSNLAPSMYSVTITDKDFCNTVETYTITEEEPVINVTASIGHTCPGYNLGSVNLSVTGDDPPFSYNWSSGGNSSNPITLAVGSHTVTIFDSRGCSTTRTYTITDDNTVIQEDQSMRDDCVVEYYCNGQLVPQLTEFLGTNDQYDPSDCRYYEYKCGDGGYYYPSGPESNREFRGVEIDYDYDNCEAIRECFNGDQYGSTVYGNINEVNFHGTDDSQGGCFYCFTAEICTINVNGIITTEILDISSHLAALIVDTNPCDTTQPNSCLQDISCSFLPSNDDVFVEGYCDPDCNDNDNNLCTDSEMRNIAQGLLAPQEDPEKRVEEAPPVEDLSNEDFTVKVYPNPFKSDFHLEINSDLSRNVNLRITNVSGQLVKTLNIPVLKGKNRIEIKNLELQSSGIYYLTLSDKDNSNLVSFPIIKQ